MPQIDYTKVSSQPLAAVAYDGPRFYDGTPGHETVSCPRCRRQSDPLFPHDDDTPGCRSIAAGDKRRSSWT